MESLYLLVPLSVLLAFAIGAIFWWAVNAGQFDDLDGPAHRILMDDHDGSNHESRITTHAVRQSVDVDQAAATRRG